ncbi:tannase/feruloyl esterase family alpha/beta hydrolase [uncultured Pseudacidovorax sp.]|uniref:tannase/feruloyl esterase family alpha/beta hydrolase n=1 Tax=uncultured Pseudacidovorax sp. TaxID=679313 RepID=UPI0025E5AC35|nr:tannase/feruloyl esterase family alpha/beta hydrolase [uncultured Pseudacidovorax sp.]
MATAGAASLALASGSGLADGLLPVGTTSVSVTVSAATRADLGALGATLNGKDVTAALSASMAASAAASSPLTVKVDGLVPGDNVIKLFSNRNLQGERASVRVSVAMRPTVACADMQGKTVNSSAFALATGGAVINEAVLVAASTDTSIASTAPEYCRITGVINPSGNSKVINFRVAIPTGWNQKSFQIGGGGTNGSIPGFIVNPASRGGSPFAAMLPANVLSPINHGYALYGGDSGHSTGTDWIDNPEFPKLSESFENFTFASQKKTRDAAMAVMELMYGKKAAVNYWAGQSQGGREALSVLTRYPADYDGIFSGDFLAYFANLNFNPQLQGALQVPDGAWIPSTKQAALRAEVLRQCDALDGLPDGVINNYLACNALFDPTKRPTALSALRCAGAEDATCLTDRQLQTIQGPAFLSDVTYTYPLKNNETSYPGWGAWEGVTLLTATQPTLATGTTYGGAGGGGLGGALVRQYFCGNQTACNVLQVFSDLVGVKDRVQVLSEAVDINDDWSAYRARGGKVILNTSATDNIANPRAQFKLFDRVVSKLGQPAVSEFIRYYVSPMTGHGGNGNGATVPTGADLMTPLVLWTERGVAPPEAPRQVRLTASGTGAATVYTVSSSRPLCQYPKYPKYVGSGDPLVAESYTCVSN